ncbi:hypothetical protein KA977_04060 [Candidatus Dependentiae bacterium]|nr:hypothetical protein [Candidatus Dependentiae bacterium]
MSVIKATKWKNHDIKATVAHKKYICDKAIKQYWFNGLKPANFQQNWQEILMSSVNYSKSKRKDYRFIFSVKKENVKNKNKFLACCIQYQKKYFPDFCGLFCIHETDTQYHAHFLLNPVNIFDKDRRFHKISPAQFEHIKTGFNDYLKIFGLYDCQSFDNYKQRSWGQYFSDRKNSKARNHQNGRNYNMQMKEKFIDEFFNPFTNFLSNNSNYKFKPLIRKKWKKVNKNSYYQTKDLTDKIKEIKEKWKDIRWALLMNKLTDTKGIELFENLFALNSSSKPKLTMTFPELQNKCNAANLSQLFSEAKQLSNQFQYINDCVSLELNKVKDDDFCSSISR